MLTQWDHCGDNIYSSLGIEGNNLLVGMKVGASHPNMVAARIKPECEGADANHTRLI